MNGYTELYTDGSYNEKLNKVTWGFIVVKDGIISYEANGSMPAAHKADVERGESAAILEACKHAKKYRGNYRLYTDSKSVINKIGNRVPNATRNPDIAGIQNILRSFRESMRPESLVIEYHRRCSDKFSEHVDSLCRLFSGIEGV
jgi:ribonuclease HI